MSFGSRIPPKYQQPQSPSDAIKHILAMERDASERAVRYTHRNNNSRAQQAEQNVQDDSQEPPLTTMTQFIQSDDRASHSRSASPTRFEPLKLIPEGKEDFEPTQRDTIEVKTTRAMQRMINGTSSNTITSPSIGTSSDSDGSDPRLPTVTKVVYIERPPPEPKSPTKKRFLGMNINIPSFRSSPNINNGGSSPHTPEDFTGAPKAAEVLGAAEPKLKRSRSKRRKSASKGESVPKMPGLFWNASTSRISLSRKDTEETSQDDIPKVPNHPLLRSNIKVMSNPKGHSRENSRTVSDSKAVPPGNGTKDKQSNLPRSQSLKYFDGNESPPPTPPAKNTPPNQKAAPAKPVPVLRSRSAMTIESFNMEDYANGPKSSSPIKIGGRVISNNVALQHVPSNYSMHANIQHDDSSHTLLGYTPTEQTIKEESKRWSDGTIGTVSTSKHQSQSSQPHLDHLDPRFYTPSLYSMPSELSLNFKPSANKDPKLYTLPGSGSSRSSGKRTQTNNGTALIERPQSPTRVKSESNNQQTSTLSTFNADTSDDSPAMASSPPSRVPARRLPNPAVAPPRLQANMSTNISPSNSIPLITGPIVTGSGGWSPEELYNLSPTEQVHNHTGQMAGWAPYDPSIPSLMPTPLDTNFVRVNQGAQATQSAQAAQGAYAPKDVNITMEDIQRMMAAAALGSPSHSPSRSPSPERVDHVDFADQPDISPQEQYLSDEHSRRRSDAAYNHTSFDLMMQQHAHYLSSLNEQINEIREAIETLQYDQANTQETVEQLSSTLDGLVTKVQGTLVDQVEGLLLQNKTISEANALMTQELNQLKSRVRTLEHAHKEDTDRQIRKQEEKLARLQRASTRFSPSPKLQSRLSPSNSMMSSPLPVQLGQFQQRSREERAQFCADRGQLRAQNKGLGMHPLERENRQPES